MLKYLKQYPTDPDQYLTNSNRFVILRQTIALKQNKILFRLWCDRFCKDTTLFPAISFLLDLIDKAHTVGHENNFFIFFRRGKTYLQFLFGQITLFLKYQFFSCN